MGFTTVRQLRLKSKWLSRVMGTKRAVKVRPRQCLPVPVRLAVSPNQLVVHRLIKHQARQIRQHRQVKVQQPNKNNLE